MVSLELLTSEGTVPVVFNLGNEEELTVGELSDTVTVSESTVRKRLDSLESEGLVDIGATLVDESGDRRTKKVYSLTEDGEQLRDTLDKVVD